MKASRLNKPYRILFRDHANHPGRWCDAADLQCDLDVRFWEDYADKHFPNAVIEICYVRNLKRDDYDVLKRLDMSL